jgi:hypothetical protein
MLLGPVRRSSKIMHRAREGIGIRVVVLGVTGPTIRSVGSTVGLISVAHGHCVGGYIRSISTKIVRSRAG